MKNKFLGRPGMKHGIANSIILATSFILCQGFQVKDNVAGKHIYEKKCKKCHGSDGTKGAFKAANLQASRLDNEMITTLVFYGRNRMPSFKKLLSQDDIAAVAGYVFTLRK